MTTPTYDEVLRLANLLPARERERLARNISAALSLRDSSTKTHSIREVRGCGKEMWRAMDVDEYLRQERDDWDGSKR